MLSTNLYGTNETFLKTSNVMLEAAGGIQHDIAFHSPTVEGSLTPAQIARIQTSKASALERLHASKMIWPPVSATPTKKISLTPDQIARASANKAEAIERLRLHRSKLEIACTNSAKIDCPSFNLSLHREKRNNTDQELHVLSSVHSKSISSTVSKANYEIDNITSPSPILRGKWTRITNASTFLHELNLNLVLQERDGNSLFRCFAYHLYKDPERHFDVRKDLMCYIGEHAEGCNNLSFFRIPFF